MSRDRKDSIALVFAYIIVVMILFWINYILYINIVA